MGENGHRCRGTHPEHVFFFAVGTEVVADLACIYIGCADIECHGITGKGVAVKGIKFIRKRLVAELGTEIIAGLQKGTETSVARVFSVFFVVTYGTADLAGFEITAEYGTGRNACRAVKIDVVFEKDVNDTAGKHPAHGAAFHNEC